MKPNLISDKTLYQLLRYNKYKSNENSFFKKIINLFYQHIGIVIVSGIVIAILYFRYINKDNIQKFDTEDEEISHLLDNIKETPNRQFNETKKRQSDDEQDFPVNYQDLVKQSYNNDRITPLNETFYQMKQFDNY